MSKLAIVLGAVFFASAVKASAWTSALKVAQRTAQEEIDSAFLKVELKLEPLKKKADNEISEVFNGTITFGHTVWEEIREVTQNASAVIGKLAGRVETGSIFECIQMSARLVDIAKAVVLNTSACFAKELDIAYGYMSNINEASEEVLSDLYQIRKDARRCGDNVVSLKYAVTASTCVQMAAANATWVADKFLLELPTKIPNLDLLMENLVPNIDECARWNGYFTLREKSSTLVDRTRDCMHRKFVETANAACFTNFSYNEFKARRKTHCTLPVCDRASAI